MKNNTPKVSICLVTWNSFKFLPHLFESIFSQTVILKKDYDIKISINVVDSGSADESVSFLQKNYPECHILKNTHNLGFARSYNQAIRMSQADYVLVLNADIVLEDDYLEKLLEVIKKDKKIAAVSGKLKRAHFTRGENSDIDNVKKTNIIDSFGLEIKRNRRFINIGEGQEDVGQYDKLEQVFGFAAAAVLFSRAALEEVRYNNQYFDEDFFAYKEDIDLAWRFNIAGFKSVLVKETSAYHFRSAKNNIQSSSFKIASSYKSKNKLIRQHSYKNHLLLLIKNETKRNFIKDSPFIFWYEFRKFIYLLIFDLKTLFGIKSVIKLISQMRRKRKELFRHRKVNAEKIRKWIK